jgi:hypothetical protein
MGILDFFRKDEVVGTKVLVCALETRFEDFLKEDSDVYRRYYPATTTEILPSIQALLGRLEQRYDVVHILCNVSAKGAITDANGNEITGTQLIQHCSEQNVKLLWAASDNPPDLYIKGFGARGKRLNLVMTLKRKGPNFPDFLRQLISRMSCGDTMPVVWSDLCPQIPGSDHPGAPESIFFAGRGGVRLLS